MASFVHEMESSNAIHYVAGLERHIYHLQRILREWTPYIPQHVLVRSQIPLETTPSHLLQPPNSQTLSVTQRKRVSLSGSSRSEDTWMKPLESFINKIPCAEKWSGAVSSSFPRISVLDLLFQSEGCLRDSDPPTSAIPSRHSDIIQTLGDFASLAQKCANNAKWTRLMSSYQNFLLSALCHVACCLGVDPNSVNKMMRCISKGGANHLQELRHGAAWGVEAIDRLQTESGWDIRSGDILFYFTPTFTSLRYWAKATKSIPIFTTRLKEDQYKKSPESLHSNHLSVPCIIKCIFGKSVQFSDVCNVLHCNFDIALESFAKWYLDPFGSDAMDELERQRLFFPVHQFSLDRQADFGVESQTERDSQPARDLLHEARKRRRVGSGTNSNLDGPSLNPILSANVQLQTTSEEDPNRSIPNLSDQERTSLSRNPSPEGFPHQVTCDHRLRLVSPDPQYTVHGRQTACSLPQIHQDDSRRSSTMMNDHYRPGGQVGIVRQTISPAILPLEPSPSFTDHQSPLHFRRAAIGSLERDLPTSSGIRGSAISEMLNVSNAAVCDEVILPPIGRTGVANGLHGNLATSDGSQELHSQFTPSNQSFVGGYPSQYSTAGQGAQYAGVGEPQVVDTSLCSHNMLSSLLFEEQEGPHIDAEPQRVDTSLRSHYMLHDLLDQFEQSRQQPDSDITYQTQFTV